MQISTLLSIKTGGCPEDCAYCPQSSAYETGVDASKLMGLDAVLAEARAARDAGATRFCMGAAWRSPKDRDLDAVCAMVEGVRALGLESCVTLGMLTGPQAARLAGAGLDYYNHNLDTSPEHYGTIITTRVYQDRLDTLAHVREAGIAVCCGGIVGMGEAVDDRAGLIAALASLAQASRECADQCAGAGGGHAAGAERADRCDRFRAGDRRGADCDAAILCASFGGAGGDERRGAGIVFHGGCQLDLLWGAAADDG